jgi:uncharacterized protein YecT (DUF1311 family)
MDSEAKTGAEGQPLKPPSVKLRRQGETLRIVVAAAQDSSWQNWPEASHPSCKDNDALTGSYFAGGKPDPALTSDKTVTDFVAPSFDCPHPFSASDEEICADPDLAAGDVRLNQAWKALLPRLDEATRRALMDDQRHWIRAQANAYTEFLHPDWNKVTSFMHFTSNARFELDSLQRERIALLEGFDDKRTGLAGVWLSYTAILNLTTANDGGIEGKVGNGSKAPGKTAATSRSKVMSSRAFSARPRSARTPTGWGATAPCWS